MKRKNFYERTKEKWDNAKKETKKAIVISGLCAVMAIPGYKLPFQYVHIHVSPKVSESKVEEFVEEEKQKFGFNENIEIKLVDSNFFLASSRTKEGKHKITFNKQYLCEAAIKHELYHIVKGHTLNDDKNFFEHTKSQFVDEYMATFYQFGLIDK